MILVIVSTQLSLFIQGLVKLREVRVYSQGSRRPKSVRAMAVVFPLHFALFEQVRLDRINKRRIPVDKIFSSNQVRCSHLEKVQDARLTELTCKLTGLGNDSELNICQEDIAAFERTAGSLSELRGKRRDIRRIYNRIQVN